MGSITDKLLSADVDEQPSGSITNRLLSPEAPVAPQPVKPVEEAPPVTVSTAPALTGRTPGRVIFDDALTFGFEDEISGASAFVSQIAKNAVQATAGFLGGAEPELGSPTEAFRQRKLSQRKFIEEQRAELGEGKALGIEIGAGLLAAGPQAGLQTLATGARAVPRAIGLLQSTKEGLKLGALFGGISTLGRSEKSLTDKPAELGLEVAAGVTIGAGAGGVLGFGLPALFNGVAKTFSVGKSIIGKTRLAATERKAIGEIMRAFRDDGISPDQAKTALAEWQRQGGEPARLVDLGGENVASLARSMGGKMGPARTIVQNESARRLNTQADNISDGLARTVSGETNYGQAVSDLIELRKGMAAPLYEVAYSTTDDVGNTVARTVDIKPQLASIFRRGSGKKAIDQAVKIIDEEGGVRGLVDHGFVQDDKGKWIPGKQMSVEALDFIKRGYDDVLDGFRNKLTGKLELDNIGRAVNNTRKEFLNIVDDAVPEYAAAREAWSSNTEVLGAMDTGRKIFTLKPDALAARMKGMKSSDREFVRAGVVRAITDKVEGTVDGAVAARKFFGTEAMRKKLRTVFDNEMQADAFEAMIRRELDRVALGQFISPRTGAQTGPRGEDIGEVAGRVGGDIVSELAAGRGPPGVLGGAISRTVARGLRDTQRATREQTINETIARKLLENPNPERMLSDLAAIQQVVRQEGLAAPAAQIGGVLGGVAGPSIAAPALQ